LKTEEKLLTATAVAGALVVGGYLLLKKAPPPPTAGEGVADIAAVDAPEEAAAGTAVTLTVTLKNVGEGEGSLYAYVKDADTGALLGSKVYTDKLPVNETAAVAWNLTMPNKQWRLTIWGGHVAP
jgi:hypothetical protein